ncbi:uncharacterized protein RJT21DRAFT_122240 [Scheffersomyces amazonensis]|uniref:uncharacterized protein n=1 Tax=Scheffersomyces amazonensis TaxID=1078765 RepID=UPI00315D1377
MICSLVYKFRTYKVRKNRTAACLKSALQSPKPVKNLESLPDEILVQIIDHLNQLDVLDLCLVNSKFHELCMNKLFKRVLQCCDRGGSHVIFHRKLNTSIYTNFTVLSSPFCSYRSSPFYPYSPNLGKDFPVFTEEKPYPTIILDDFCIEVIGCKDPLLIDENVNINRITLWKDFYCDTGLQSESNTITRNRNDFCLYKKIDLVIPRIAVSTLDRLQGIFGEVSSLCLDAFMLENTGYPEVDFCPLFSLFSCENIKELQLKFIRRRSFQYFLKLMPNMKTLVINDPIFWVPDSPFEISKCSLQKFCLDVSDYMIEGVKKNCNLIKVLLNTYGSSLELIKVNMTCSPTTLTSIDLFYYCEDFNCNDFKQYTRNLVSWAKNNINNFPKLHYFTFYNYQFVIDRQVEPCQWIEVGGKEL